MTRLTFVQAVSLLTFGMLATTVVADLESQRIDCYPEAPYLSGQAIDQKCVQRHCIWSSSTRPNVPWCFFPQTNYGYTATGSSTTGSKVRVSLRRLTTYSAPFANAIDNLVLEADYVNQKVLRLKIYDANHTRYEVPLELNDVRNTGSFVSDLVFSWENRASDSMFQFKVTRRATNAVLFDTSIGGLVFEDQFLQIATILPNSSNVYGFGQNNHPSLSHDLNYKTWGMWARDEANVAGEELNQYGVHPVYNVLERDGNAYGVALINSNAQEYSFTPNPALIMRSIGGIFDFYFFAGPGPEAVVQQYTSLVGYPIMIPYFSLGFQLSRWDYKDLNDMKKIVQRNLDKGIPLDIQYADIEYMQDQMDFTIHSTKFADLPNYFRELQSKGMHVVPILDPALLRNPTYEPYSTGLNADVYIKFPAGLSPDQAETGSDIMLGYCWPNDKVVYPDFMLDRSEQWWINEILEFRRVNITFDAIWIDMNEPAVFDTNEEKPWNWPEDRPPPYWTLKCPVNRWDDPPYRTKAAYRYDSAGKSTRLSQKTLCLVGLQKDGQYRHYDVHNLYGLFESKHTMKAVRQATGKRSFVLSRSTFIGSGRYTGSWLGDNDSSFKDLHRSIIGMIESGIFGIPYIGADICGFTSETNEELCTRWQQIGAFYPYSRNHNVKGSKDQDPASFSQAMIDSTVTALNIRYEILPYYYTLFYRAHVAGNLVVRGLFQEFPSDDNCRRIDKQFLVGPAWLVSGVVENGKRTLDAYFPTQSKWYNYYTGDVAPKGYATLQAPLNFINLHVRGGYIVPTQKPDINTSFSRKNPFDLIVALDVNKLATGELFWDDGDSIDSIEKSQYFLAKFLFSGNKLTMTINTNNYAGMDTLKLDSVRLLGFADVVPKSSEKPQLTIEVRQNSRLQIVEVSDFDVNEHGEVKLTNLNINMNEDFEINFKQVIIQETIDINDERLRSDCHPDPGSSQSRCESRGCTWKQATLTGQAIPWCFIGKTRASYTLQGAPTTTPGTERSTAVYKANKAHSNSFYGEDLTNLRITVELKGAKQARLKIEDDTAARYEVPVKTSWANAVTAEEGSLAQNDFDVRIESDASNRVVFEVYRKSTGSRLFSTREYAEAYVFSDRYIQFYARLATENAYGFGESTHDHFRHRFTHEDPIYPVWARDEPPAGGARALYGTQPFYMCVEQDGSAHGLLILNSNAQEYRFTSLRTFMYRTLGGVIDIYMFSGPTPENVIQQYAMFIGTPMMPPYYALGFQISKYGYNNLATLRQMIDRNLAANIPLDIQYGDIDHFEKNKDFTYDTVNFNGMPAYLDQLRTQNGIRFIPIVDPALVTNEANYMPYQRGMQSDVWIKWDSDSNPQASETVNRNMLGYVWPEGKVLFPDFFKNATIDWWSNEIALYYNNVFKFAGLWIDMNEPANFGTNLNKPFNYPDDLPPWSLKCPYSKWDDPPYRTAAAWGERLSDKTLCLAGVQTDGVTTYRQYDTHNLFGYTQTIATFEALRRLQPNKRPLIITRSNFPGSGKMAGHWLGDNTSNWKHLKYNLIGVLEYNLFLIPYIGADICGFFGDADAELCERWMQLGAFNPFFRNHNGLYGTPQDPAAFGAAIAESMRKTIEIRYTLNPYLYTLFSEVHQRGGTVVRSLTHEFPQDKGTLDIDEQFLWGSGLLISPVIHQSTTVISAYFPPEARWYSYYDGREVQSGFVKLYAPHDFIPLHVRGGSILPTQDPAKNTDESRKNPFGVIVAPGFDERAAGTLYWDDGESLDSITANKYSLYQFSYQKIKDESVLDITVARQGYSITNRLNTVRIFDVIYPPKSFKVDSVVATVSYSYDQFNEALVLNNLNLSMTANHKIEIFF